RVGARARQVADKIGYDVLGGGNLLSAEDVAGIRQELRETRQVRIALEEFWPALTPQRLISDLFESKERLEAAAPGLDAPDRDALLRPAGGGWTAADVPLLDEAAELLGEDDRTDPRVGGRRGRRGGGAFADGGAGEDSGQPGHADDDRRGDGRRQ